MFPPFHRAGIGVLCCLGISWFSAPAKAEFPVPHPPRQVLVVGFVGGIRNPEDLRQGVVQIRDRVNQLDCEQITAKTYSHWHWRKAYEFIFQTLDRNQDHRLSATEIEAGPKLVVYGHSLGGWAVVKLARKLERIHLPVELAVQIDSVGIGDEVIPQNVKTAANFFQRTEWPVRGESTIRARNGHQTKIAGNFLVDRVGHDALARKEQVSDLVFETVRSLCFHP